MGVTIPANISEASRPSRPSATIGAPIDINKKNFEDVYGHLFFTFWRSLWAVTMVT